MIDNQSLKDSIMNNLWKLMVLLFVIICLGFVAYEWVVYLNSPEVDFCKRYHLKDTSIMNVSMDFAAREISCGSETKYCFEVVSYKNYKVEAVKPAECKKESIHGGTKWK